jgi:hypothetical protein
MERFAIKGLFHGCMSFQVAPLLRQLFEAGKEDGTQKEKKLERRSVKVRPLQLERVAPQTQLEKKKTKHDM